MELSQQQIIDFRPQARIEAEIYSHLTTNTTVSLKFHTSCPYSDAFNRVIDRFRRSGGFKYIRIFKPVLLRHPVLGFFLYRQVNVFFNGYIERMLIPIPRDHAFDNREVIIELRSHIERLHKVKLLRDNAD